MMKMSSGI